jgi:hypothetical protein
MEDNPFEFYWSPPLNPSIEGYLLCLLLPGELSNQETYLQLSQIPSHSSGHITLDQLEMETLEGEPFPFLPHDNPLNSYLRKVKVLGVNKLDPFSVKLE